MLARLSVLSVPHVKLCFNFVSDLLSDQILHATIAFVSSRRYLEIGLWHYA